MANGPIYIGGLDRCGKTTMQALLSSHPRIAIPPVGSNLWRLFYGQYGDLAREQNFERCLKAMLRYSHVQLLNPDPERIRREFRQGEATYARLFALLHEHYAQQQGKPRWGDQTGLLECYADHLFKADPEAKMIQMVRDPRDRYEASLARSPKGKGRAGGATARWLLSVRLAQRHTARYPDRYMVVRYETLVSQPEKTLVAVCDFLGEEYTPVMLTMSGAPYHRDKLMQKSGSNASEQILTDEFIGAYRGVVPPREIAFMQLWAGREMVAYGYELEPIHFSLGDWVSFFSTDFPANLLRALAWRGVEAVHDRLPMLFGRKPDPKYMVDHKAKPPKRLADDLVAG
jgi:hypothetical protein